ncbi:MAG: thiol peroxidase [bacterium]
MATFSFEGNEYHSNGDLPAVGSSAPDLNLVSGDLGDVVLADFAGKKVLINIVVSLDLEPCAVSTRKFAEVSQGRPDLVYLVVSADLPFAQARFSDLEGLKNIYPLSMMRSRSFAKDYGVLIEDGPLAGTTASAVVALDENDNVLYAEWLPDLTQEPDYDAALAALK